VHNALVHLASKNMHVLICRSNMVLEETGGIGTCHAEYCASDAAADHVISRPTCIPRNVRHANSEQRRSKDLIIASRWQEFDYGAWAHGLRHVAKQRSAATQHRQCNRSGMPVAAKRLRAVSSELQYIVRITSTR
jgi:hypothetical protein